ncbi:DUF1217 domain-containing protein [Fertoebacter nigrum]|uniref:DUF1217 domain-containing protein n=1 Tax=Fertoeibacter niger TaxID=2656921 RepID=A0A8X8KR83_9RHOB|nr:DUF1217 domain-containing protein [Fertoeibacter niger]NUB44917.1 DUF1217 domain-containing protein [Fertoeibacter niger]
MSFAPVVPLSGYGGWAFLKRTMESQKAAFAASPATKTDEAWFRERIGSITRAEDLVADRRLLKVALGAFGLDGGINNKFFIQKVLESRTLDTGALANRLADKQYQKLAQAFGFADFATPRTQLSDFADRILRDYGTRQFEIAVGAQNDDLRLAMHAERELPVLALSTTTQDTKWFTIMGSAPLRQVFQTAFGLPTGFGALDLDQQLATLKSRAAQVFGDSDVAQFTDPAQMETLLRRFLARSDAAAAVSPTARGAAALQLLQAGQQSAGNFLSLLR